MQVFKRAIDKNGGKPLPLNVYLQPTVESCANVDPASIPPLTPDQTFINRTSFFDALLNDRYFPIVSAFLLGGMPPTVKRSEDGATPLHVAVSGTTKVTLSSPLEESGPVRNIFDPPCPNQLIISFLIDNGADVDAENHRGETALMTAVAAQNMRAVRLLLAKGADLQHRDTSGRSVLHYAAPHPHMIQSLQVWIGAEELPRLAQQEQLLHTVCRRTGTALSALFLIEQLELDVNSVQTMRGGSNGSNKGTASVAVGSGSGSGGSASGVTPLHCAVLTGDVELVKALLSKGADPRKADGVEGGETPLMLAAQLAQRHAASKKSAGQTGLVNHVGVNKLLRRYTNTAPNTRQQEKVLEDASTQLWEVNGASQWLQGLAVAVAPHVALLVACTILDSFSLLLGVVVVLLFVMFRVRITDENLASVPLVPSESDQWKPQLITMSGLPRRPLRTFGLFVGFLVAFFWSVHLEWTEYLRPRDIPVDLSRRVLLVDDAARAAHDLAIASTTTRVSRLHVWGLLPVAVVTLLCGLVVLLKNPGTVASTPGQRKGIYANILRAKGVPSKELRYSTDLVTMVKKPLRAQHCPFTERTVLRYDHFSLHLASPIGARNIRAYVYGHLALCIMFVLMAVVSAGLTSVLSLQWTMTATVIFSSPALRLAYMYTRVLLPTFIFMSGFIVFEQVLAIRRNVTSFDISHATDESSLYCFELGQNVYSLFDRGPNENMKRFFLGVDKLDEVSYRVPQLSPHLAALVREHERWQLNPENQACCGEEGGATAVVMSEEARAQGQLDFLTGATEAVAAANAASREDTSKNKEAAGSEAPWSVPVSSKKQIEAGETVPAEDAASLAYGLFQELIRHGGDPELFRTAQRANRAGFIATVNAELSEEEAKRQQDWDDAVAQAREMYRVFQDNMNQSMKRFVEEHTHDANGAPVPVESDKKNDDAPATVSHGRTVQIPVVEETFVAAGKRD